MLSFFTGVVTGVVHVLAGPDHLAAVSPLVAEARHKTERIGFFWGLGHSSGVWIIAAVALALRQRLVLETMSRWSERFVGVVLIVIGLWALRKAINLRIHVHEHDHDGTRHVHYHLHRKPGRDHARAPHAHTHAPFGIGLLHGVAGGSHLVGVLPALGLPGLASPSIYLAGYTVGSIAAMSGFSWLLGLMVRAWRPGDLRGYAERRYGIVLGVFALVALGVGVAWLGVL